jgi:DNA-binding GntR family transcriptional regulator
MLVENNLVDKAPHKGYSVKQLDLQEIHELYDVRMALEIYVIERLIQRGYPQQEWDMLRRTWQDMRKAPMTASSDFAARDEEFHETLATWTGNRTLLHQICSIDERLHFIRVTDITTPERLRKTCEQHLRILECIKNKDMECAREALQMNIEEGRKNVDHAIKEALARAYLGSKGGA